MKLYLPSYSQGSHLITEAIEPAEIEMDTVLFSKAIELRIHLDRNDPYLRLNYKVRTEVSRVCDRCLEDYEYPLDLEGMLLVILRQNPRRGEEKEDDVRYVPEDTLEIDLSADLRDILMINLPTKSLCRNNCKGLCSQCGQNLNDGLCSCPHN